MCIYVMLYFFCYFVLKLSVSLDFGPFYYYYVIIMDSVKKDYKLTALILQLQKQMY